MNSRDVYSSPPFWSNGPTPGKFYNFPNMTPCINHGTDGRQHSQAPVTTASSLVAFKFNGGVIMAGDILGSYGSLARYRNCPRLMKVNENMIIGAGGDYGDFQYVKDLIEQKIIDEQCLDDGFKLKPKSMYCWLTRIMYNRRSKFDPFWNNLVVAGLQDGVPFLGTVDKLGTAYEDAVICTGYGAHMATPVLRAAMEKNANMSLNEAKQLIAKCMEILFYRDARSYPKYQLGVITKDNVSIEGPLDVAQEWNVAHVSNNM